MPEPIFIRTDDHSHFVVMPLDDGSGMIFDIWDGGESTMAVLSPDDLSELSRALDAHGRSEWLLAGLTPEQREAKQRMWRDIYDRLHKDA